MLGVVLSVGRLVMNKVGVVLFWRSLWVVVGDK